MANTNYTLNLDNLIDFLNIGDEWDSPLHYWLGIPNDRAQEISNHAYNIVWDQIESEEFATVRTLVTLFKEAREKNYNDTELTFYLYWGFSEIDAFLNPTLQINFEEEPPPPQEN